MKKIFTSLRTFLPRLVIAAILITPLAVSAQTPAATPTATPAATPAATTPTTAAAPATTFVPLNPIPGILDAASSPSLPTFFNNLYKICIGVAASIAVLQLMRAGFMFMVNKGSVSHNEAAKSIISNSILGLVLVLSPAIVFGIINPSILNLNLNVTALQPKPLATVDTSSPKPATGQFSGADAYLWEHTPDPANDAGACAASNGTLFYQCRKKDESGGREIAQNDSCTSDENKYSVCSPGGSVPSSGAACTAQYGSTFQIQNLDKTTYSCDASAGYVSVPHGCCSGSNPAGTLCCAKPAGAAAQSYLLAFYFTKTNTTTKYTCYEPAVYLYPSAATCATGKANAPKTVGQSQGVTTMGSIQYVKSCVATTLTSYDLPAPNNLPKCP
ncbi:hypothetical protein BH11PAT2_BH11PAT2_08640 [soil metagenome]